MDKYYFHGEQQKSIETSSDTIISKLPHNYDSGKVPASQIFLCVLACGLVSLQSYKYMCSLSKKTIATTTR